jgi:DNA-binding NarL/FixJ family response regulator
MPEHANRPVDLKVLVVGNDSVLRRGIIQFLNTVDVSLSAYEASFESVVSDIVGDIDWGLIVFDFETGGDLAILKRIREARPGVRMLVLNSGNSPFDVKAALAAGALGYLDKNSPVQVWHDAFAVVAAGGRYPPAEAAGSDPPPT